MGKGERGKRKEGEGKRNEGDGVSVVCSELGTICLIASVLIYAAGTNVPQLPVSF